jgi:hypothetical protein
MIDRSMRRRVLRLAALTVGGMSGLLSDALAKGDLGGQQGVVRLEGEATIDGKRAAVGTPVALGSRVATSANGKAVVVVGQDAFLLRESSVIVVQGERGVLSQMLVETGRVLSVFSKKPLTVKASMASIGIRGTGAYLEVDDRGVYFCLCYGEALVEGPRMQARTVKTTHHEQPLLLRETDGVLTAEAGPFRNHTDAELIMLEGLVGREPPFMRDGVYPAGKY